MSAFKLVLCLAGLAIYLVVKQFVVHSPSSGLPSSDRPESRPAAPGIGSERVGKPQTEPHAEVLKPGREWASREGNFIR